MMKKSICTFLTKEELKAKTFFQLSHERRIRTLKLMRPSSIPYCRAVASANYAPKFLWWLSNKMFRNRSKRWLNINKYVGSDDAYSEVYLTFLKIQWITNSFYSLFSMSDSKSSSVPGGKRLRRIRNILLILLMVYIITSLTKFCLAQWVYWGPPISNSVDHCALIGALFQAVHSIGEKTVP